MRVDTVSTGYTVCQEIVTASEGFRVWPVQGRNEVWVVR